MLTLGIYLMGALTVLLSCVVAYRFYRQSRDLRGDSGHLSHALSWQLLGEAVIGLGTLVFAYSAHRGWLGHWSIELQSTIRFVMFLATSLTTIHLYRTILRIS